MKPSDMGTLIEECADRGARTTVHLDRPLDIAPAGGVDYDLPRLAGLVRSASGWLAATGARPGDRVAIHKANHWDSVLLACAAVRIGALPALISAYLPAETAQILLKRLDPAVLVTDRGTVVAARDAGTDLTALARRTLCLDDPGPAANVLTLADVRGHDAPPAYRRHDDEPLVVNHTSGTTGVPKLVVHSTETLVRRLARFEAVRWPLLGVRTSDTVVTAGSFAHGRLFCWTASALCLAPRKIGIVTDFEPARAEPFLRAHPPSTLEALPSVFVRWRSLTAGAANPFREVRLYASTYDAMHPPVVRAFLAASARRFPVWLQGWGQTETGPLTFRFLTRRSVARVGERHPTTRDLGRPIPGRVAMRAVDPDTFEPVRPGEPGLLLARTRARCLGYVGEQERWTAKVSGEWWNTGDVGSIGRTGDMRLLDREVDTVPELSCLETEDVIEDRLASVLECVVLGATGRRPLPVVVTADGRLDPVAWRESVADLPALAEPVPMTWSDVPRTATGKVRRTELADRLLDAADRPGPGRWT
ncbi:class I adenylate-forming enzyme family protein [Actinophytocola sp.]|uniref:class I adenylate-forming enzyme family protein n=1 Tax=Actinophytocola sp. TaxID=1872138 RepID=UPI003D6B44AD